MDKPRFRGVLPPMITPFMENGDVDFIAFAENVEHWNNDHLAGYLVNGSNSETAFMNEEEKLKLLRITVEKAAQGRVIVAGTGMESLRETIYFTNLCADAGAQYALVLTPSYYDSSMDSTALIDFFTRLADASKIPVLIYNVSKFTHINIKADAVAKLAKHKNIIGMKDSQGDVPQLANFKRITDGEDFEIFVGTASAWYSALGLDVIAGIHAAANCVPNACAAVQKAFDASDFIRARAIYQAVFPLNAAVTGTFGVAGLKYAAELFGYRGGYVRCPLQPLSENQKTTLREIVETTKTKLAELDCRP